NDLFYLSHLEPRWEEQMLILIRRGYEADTASTSTVLCSATRSGKHLTQTEMILSAGLLEEH
ncbi:Hypothetical predicted protein, partial [Podarcis lilfordi]